MWYIIIQILFIIIGCILAASYNRYLTKKYKGTYYNIEYSLVFLVSIIWPLAILVIPSIFLYKKYIKEKLNNFINKLSEVWENII
jgi:predicted PurR-regulated permease PerM